MFWLADTWPDLMPVTELESEPEDAAVWRELVDALLSRSDWEEEDCALAMEPGRIEPRGCDMASKILIGLHQ